MAARRWDKTGFGCCARRLRLVSQDKAADWLEKVYQIALSKPHVETITWQDLVDRRDGVLLQGGLLHPDMSAKPVFEKLCELKRRLIRPNRNDSSKKTKHKPSANE